MGSASPDLVDIMKKRASELRNSFYCARSAVAAAWLLLACQANAVEAILVELASATSGHATENGDSQSVPAPPVDLDQPLPEAQPLSVSADDSEQGATLDDAPELAKPAPVITQAKSVDLGEPLPAALPLQVVDDKPVEHEQAKSAVRSQPVAEPKPGAAAAQQAEVGRVLADKTAAVNKPAAEHGPFVMLGAEVAPGTSTRLAWSPSHSFEGIAVSTPVLVVNGSKPGPVLCLTAAVHGDELNGIEIVRRVLYNLNAVKLSGTVIGVPIVNLQGFRRGSRYLPDRRDLNRFFPGDPRGSSASRIAHSFFHEVIDHCDALVDLHTGSFYRTNLPQLRADLRDAEVLELSQGFDGTVVLQSEGALGTLRQAAVAAGIPAVTLEAGEPLRLQETEVNHGVKTIQSLLGKMNMIKKTSFWGQPEPVYYQSAWVRADQGGILFSEVDLGERVKEKEVLGTVTDPITNVRTEILSPYQGRVLGMALNQVVMPGFAAFRIGIQSSEEEVIDAVSPEAEIPSALHTSQVDKNQEEAVPEPKPADDYTDFEGLEDSE
jgi:predicted deacylase